jgi:H+/Cl- antiporter ClcA
MLGGLLGSFFIFANYTINKLRKRFLTHKWSRVVETIILVFITSTVIFFAPLLLKDDCLLKEDGRIEASYIHYTCPEDEYNPLATILLNPENSVIKAFMN